MNIVCLDMEGVLVPEIWIAFAEESGIPELKELRAIGTHAAILGKALYTGRLDLRTVIEEVGTC